jgi:hypothetical protein
MPRPPRNVTPGASSGPRPPRWLGIVALVLLVVVLCLVFPRLLAFVELAARELRYLWWLVLLAALGAYFFFFFGRKKD